MKKLIIGLMLLSATVVAQPQGADRGWHWGNGNGHGHGNGNGNGNGNGHGHNHCPHLPLQSTAWTLVTILGAAGLAVYVYNRKR